MAVGPSGIPTRLERDCVRLCVKSLEYKAAKGPVVQVSDRFALVVAKHLRRLLERYA